MTRYLRHLFAAVVLAAWAAFAAHGAPPEGDPPPADILAALTEETVQIRSNFAGAEITLYGAVRGFEEGDDIAIAVRGPARDVRVMQKVRTLGIWINRAPIRFESVPGYYAVAATAPLSEFASFSALRRNSLGTGHVYLSAPETESLETRFGVSDVRVSTLGAEIVDYREALVRIKNRDGLYYEASDGVELIEGGLFSAEVRLPPRTPVGIYQADVYLFRDGEPIASRRVALRVEKAGIERLIYEMAHNSPLAYGLVAVILAVVSGWGAAEIFRRR
ncbi:membrane protein [Marinicauda pacifica]|jgi:uncharacterized protein (TIGR02186 family)|uniref:TIGR02186 family protein n=1 Tax=Marinicauda pacifica TaxID=1133559 RepID=A0A4S2HA53_9PROT|nr:TIGR02186 family protein [Marinicauda pacifica]TGY92795.1 hypothetical protein E5162_06890 [Marinicauda pacifica]GGE40430.1 membrane protein [Marinicauda pacifica]